MKSFLYVLLSLLTVSSTGFAQGHLVPGLYQDYAGAIGPGDFCSYCAFENRADVPTSGKARYLVNNDRYSITARCRELGWDSGQALELYTHQEWCRYGNARTRTWDPNNRRWMFGNCTNGNVKLARCFRR